MSSINLYNVLDIEQNASKKDITMAYRKLIQKYHPDKPGGDADLCELINYAYDTLRDNIKRASYDNQLNEQKKSSKSHESFKNEFKLYEEADINKLSLEESQDAFLDFFKTKDSKHNFNREQYEFEKENKLTSKELEQMGEDLKLEREDDLIECIPDNIFEGKFNNEQFNSLFEKMSGGLSNSTSIMKVGEDDYGMFNDGFVSIEHTYGDLNDSYSNLNTDKFNLGDSNTLNEIKELLKNPEQLTSEYSSHNKKNDEQYKKELEEKLKNLEEERQQDINLQFDKDNDEFMFSQEVDFNVLELDTEESFKKNYAKLLFNRNQDSSKETKEEIKKE